MEKVRENHAAGISMITFIIGVAISLAYYQFIYLQEVNAKPQISPEIANPGNALQVSIVEGSALPTNEQFF
jgi:hypothetical protein